MRSSALLTLLALSFTLTACASPSFVGRWHTNQLPDSSMPEGTDSLTLMINEDQTYAAHLENKEGAALAGFSGQWKQQGEKQIRFTSDGRGPKGTAQLLDPDTLLATDEDDNIAVKLQRAEQ